MPAPTTCSLHPEAGPHLHRSLQLIRSHGKTAGVVLNPATPAETVAWVLDLVDIILVMTVNPGFGGQAFLPSQLPKIAALRRMIDAADHPIALAVDGGITPATAPRVIARRRRHAGRRHRGVRRGRLRRGDRRIARRAGAPAE